MMRYRRLLVILISFFIGLISVNPVSASVPSLLFEPSSMKVAKGSDFVVDVRLNTAGQEVSGAGVKLKFDPSVLMSNKIIPGSIFADYPAIITDNSSGQIAISGIAASPSIKFVGDEVFASIYFRTLNTGTTQVSIVYMPGSTTDSNIAVMADNPDILSEVNQLNIVIEEGQVVSSERNTETPKPLEPKVNGAKTIVKRIASTLGIPSTNNSADREGRETVITNNEDPLAPIKRTAPITDSSEKQPVASAPRKNYNPWLYVGIGVLLSIIILLLFLLFSSGKDRQVRQP